MISNTKRCFGGNVNLMNTYHDKEWGVPVHDDKTHYEFLVLEGAQTGLSWMTILHRRDEYRKAFSNFDPNIVAQYTPKKVDELLEYSGIIRNRRKIESAIKNAQAFLKIQDEYSSFDKYLWSWVENKPIINSFVSWSEVPPLTELSTIISKDLKKHGFSFVGPTVIYSHMQATGLVNDHLINCFRWKEINEIIKKNEFTQVLPFAL